MTLLLVALLLLGACAQLNIITAVGTTPNLGSTNESVYLANYRGGQLLTDVGLGEEWNLYGAMYYTLSNCSGISLMSNGSNLIDVKWGIYTWNTCTETLTSMVPAVDIKNTSPDVPAFYDPDRHLIWWVDYLHGQLSSVFIQTGRYLGSNVTIPDLPVLAAQQWWTVDTKRHLFYFALFGDYSTSDPLGLVIHQIDLRARRHITYFPYPGSCMNGMEYDPHGDRIIVNMGAITHRKSEYVAWDIVGNKFTHIADSQAACFMANNMVYNNQSIVHCGLMWSNEYHCEWLDVKTNKTALSPKLQNYWLSVVFDQSIVPWG